MKNLQVIAAAFLLVIIIPGIAYAWEFKLRGEHELRYRYIARTGPHDLFGDADYAQHRDWTGINWPYVTSIGLTGPNNGYLQVEGYSSKGADAAYAEQRFWLYPTFEINKAISVHSILAFSGNLNARYNPISPPEPEPLSGWNAQTQVNHIMRPSENWATNPHYSGWVMLDSRDIVSGVGMFVPVGYALWCQIRTPWGLVLYGRRPAGFGIGWAVHADDNYTTSLSLVVPYGPLTFIFSQYLHDNGEDTDPNNYMNRFADFRQTIPDIEHWQSTIASAVDQNEVTEWNQAVAVKYVSGNFDMGAMARVLRWSNVHTFSRYDSTGGPGARPWPLVGTLRDDGLWLPFATSTFLGLSPTSSLIGAWAANQPDPNRLIPAYADVFFLLSTVYMKYRLGQLAFNAEYDFQFVEVRRRGSRPVSGFPQAWAAELNYMAGPLKLSLGHFYRSGHDRRGLEFNLDHDTGHIIGPIYANDKWDFFLPAWGAGQAPIKPYNFLLGLYGTGNNSYNSAGICTYTDFLGYAARVDYALAANLNLFASFIHAERASNTGTSAGSFEGWFFEERFRGEIPKFFPTFQTPLTVPDNYLGWEADIGLNWKILENLTFNSLFAYWQPGDWFKFAYNDRSRETPFVAVRTPPRNPGRVIDPLIGIQSSLLVEF